MWAAISARSILCLHCSICLVRRWPEHLAGESRTDVLQGQADLNDNDVVIQHNGVGDRDLTSAASSHPDGARARTSAELVEDGSPAQCGHFGPLEADPVRRRLRRAVRPEHRPGRDNKPV